MKRLLLLAAGLCMMGAAQAQAPQSWTSGQIFQAIKKLNVLGCVLYVAAHPDDENTRLITYLANEKLYRTGYLSLTRGDGGQNLIGQEQGVALGLIRTQELLAARRIDGGEQFFSNAYDFGYSKTPEETFTKWDKEKTLAEVVWVIRQFQPDVIITRFPTTGEGGHGHHTASAILANEAFTAAADAHRFTEQLPYVQPWQAKRIVWNTFNFGNTTSTNDGKYTIDVGGFNPLLGKSYGEIAALSRSQHKSQGFGMAAGRGTMPEYFTTTGGTAPQKDLMDDVSISWSRTGAQGYAIQQKIAAIEKAFDASHPENTVPALVQLYEAIAQLPAGYWKNKKLQEVQQLIAQCSGLFIDATTAQPFAVQGDSVKINITINNRLAAATTLKNITTAEWQHTEIVSLAPNKNYSFSTTLFVPQTKNITQPYWLQNTMEEGRFHITDISLTGIADIAPAYVSKVTIHFCGKDFTFEYPVKYRRTDPVKGEVYDPLYVIPAATLTAQPTLLLFDKNKKQAQQLSVQLHPNADLKGGLTIDVPGTAAVTDTLAALKKGVTQSYYFTINNPRHTKEVTLLVPHASKLTNKDTADYNVALRAIDYDHIPAVKYFYTPTVKQLAIDLKTAGTHIGYIPGAGDNVVDILKAMGYVVTTLDATTLPATNLQHFDAIITGVRAYNTNEWLNTYYDKLMRYVENGGNLIVQYNTSTNAGPVKAKIGPYDFAISRNRITDENAAVKLLDAANPVFHFPNTITAKDFEGWVQERSIYHAANWDSRLTPLLSMADPGEEPNEGSWLMGKYGKGYFTYTGIVFFRQLPAAVPGAIRLLANIIALNQPKK